MRVLWTHNFNPEIMNSGVFMHITAEGVRKLGVDLTLLYIGNLRSIDGLLQARKNVRQLAGKYDLIHAQYGSACAVSSAAAKGIPKVLSIRGNDWSVHSNKLDFHFLHTRLARFMTRAVIREYNAIITVSNRIASEVQCLYPNSRIFTIPSPIDLERFIPLDKERARAALGFPNNNEKWILFTSLGSNDPVKRISVAKAAVEKANDRMGNIKLRVATGFDHNTMPLFVAACDLILCTSETEGWPNSIKEALACNIPFVATDVSDLRDIAKQEPSCRICPPDTDILAENICDVLSQKTLPDLRRYVLEMGVPLISRRILDLYKSILAGP